ncbi:unnamed protein product [Rhodiola kirilowii]
MSMKKRGTVLLQVEERLKTEYRWWFRDWPLEMLAWRVVPFTFYRVIWMLANLLFLFPYVKQIKLSTAGGRLIVSSDGVWMHYLQRRLLNVVAVCHRRLQLSKLSRKLFSIRD